MRIKYHGNEIYHTNVLMHVGTEVAVVCLESKMKLITPDLDCIETNGGGSARCMIAEIFNKRLVRDPPSSLGGGQVISENYTQKTGSLPERH